MVKIVRKPVIAIKTTQKCAIPGQVTVYASQAGQVNNVIVLVHCLNMDIDVNTLAIVNLELSARRSTVNVFVCLDFMERNVSYHALKESTVRTVESHANVKTTLNVMERLVNACANPVGRTTNVTGRVIRTHMEKIALKRVSVITTAPVILKMGCVHVQLDGLVVFAIRNANSVTMDMDVN